MTKAIIFLLILGSMISCSKVADEASKAASSDCSGSSSAFPMCFSVSSLTAADSSSKSNILELKAFVSTPTISAKLPALVKANILGDIALSIGGADSTDCDIILPDLAETVPDPSCYGPNVCYDNHPDGEDGGSDGNSSCEAGEGSLPGGDLGIWDNVMSTGEACASTKQNADMEEMSIKLDSVMAIMASMRCLAGTEPAAEESIDLTGTDYNIADHITTDKTMTWTTATFSRIADSTDSKPVYQYYIVVTVGDPGTDVQINIKHSPTDADAAGTTYVGSLFAKFNGGMDGAPCGDSGNCDSVGLTLDYSNDSSNNVAYKLVSAEYMEASDIGTGIYDNDARLIYNGDWGANFSQSIVNMNMKTVTGSSEYSWSAGRGPTEQDPTEETRVFNMRVYTEDDAYKADAFFGYGEKVGAGAATGYSDDYGVGAITKFICNWAGPEHGHDEEGKYLANHGQIQLMERSAATGYYVPVTDGNFTAYAPVNACETSDDDFTYDYQNSETAPEDEHALQDLTASSAYLGYTAPTAPTVPFAPAE